MKEKLGNFENEACGRNGCEGVIQEEAIYRGGCSCSICSESAEHFSFCTSCGWESENAPL